MPAEAPLFLMYTSGTTGRPKGCQHSTGGYLAYVAGTSRYYQDIHPDDTYWCAADIGWITGHSYIVYGPLSLGTTSVMYEGVPTYPDAGRPWRIAERLGVNLVPYRTDHDPDAAQARAGRTSRYNHRFKHMTTVGEPIEPDVWRWYHDVVGKGEAVIVDTWWQTESGGFLGSTLPALQPMKPGSCGPGVPGVFPVIYDEEWRRSTGWQWTRRQHLHPQSLARHLPKHLGPARALRADLLREVLPRTRTARTGTTGPTLPATARSRPRRLLPYPRPDR